MRSIARFYATREDGRRLRRYKVVRSDMSSVQIPALGSYRRSHVQVTYTTVSRHFTAQGASRAARNLDREAGNAH